MNKTPWPARHQKISGPVHRCILQNVIGVQPVIKQGFAEGSPFHLCVTYWFRPEIAAPYTIAIRRTGNRARADAWLKAPLPDLLAAVDETIAKAPRRAA